ncbi:MAG: SRPBCC family protein [Chloroflexota bacterium]|nr:SRPBCC family protein [Chloroflexota bacterium]
MRQIIAKATDILNAGPEDVYATIADYHEGHPSILPQKNLYDLRVEQGGQGAGTIIRFKARLLGVEQSFHQCVSEPEPGRVLVEQDIDTAQKVTTTFIVTSLEEGKKSQVEIHTTMNPSPGLQGLVERLVIPMANPPIYRKELKLLEAAARQRANRQ